MNQFYKVKSPIHSHMASDESRIMEGPENRYRQAFGEYHPRFRGIKNFRIFGDQSNSSLRRSRTLTVASRTLNALSAKETSITREPSTPAFKSPSAKRPSRTPNPASSRAILSSAKPPPSKPHQA